MKRLHRRAVRLPTSRRWRPVREADCRGYTDDVARADTRRGGDHECAERGNAPLAFRLLHDDPARVLEQTNLDEPAAEREVNAADYQKQRHKPR